jgi:hypothetical protein
LFSVVLVGLAVSGCADDSNPFGFANQASFEGALLTRDEVLATGLVGSQIAVQTPDTVELQENPDPRGPCGGRDDAALNVNAFDAGIVFATPAIIIQHFVVQDSGSARSVAAMRADIAPGCPTFLSDTPYGFRQVNEFVASIELPAIGDDRVAWAATAGPEGGETFNVAAGVVVVDDFLSVVVVLGPEPSPDGLLERLTEIAGLRLEALASQSR